MNASEQVYTLLADLVNQQVFPLFINENQSVTPPYIIYQPITTTPDNTLDGVTGHEWVRMQIDIYHDDYDELLTLTSQVIAQLDTIKPSNYESSQIIYEDDLYRHVIEYGFWQTY
ncbi:DUF3168 domain-containing protein [Moraxella sp. ZJ142]|uniref:tail completion protein gp17 n=1 Tax=Moraxella marmotae TaxID=3344520 RepID=UPI0035D47A7D